MKTRTASHPWMALLGILVLGSWHGCALPEPALPPSALDPQPPTISNASNPVNEEVKPVTGDTTPKVEKPVMAPVVEAAPAPLPSSEPNNARRLIPAKTLTNIEIQRQEGSVAIVLTGDGDLSYQVMRLDGDRLVVDILDVANGTKRQTMLVGHQLVKQIRIGTHQTPQQKVRLVLDLGQSAPYSVEKTGMQLRVTLTDKPGLNPQQEALRPFVGEKESGETVKRGLPVPLPEGFKLPEPVTALAQPKPGGGMPATDKGYPEVSDKYTGKRISLDFQDADISSVLRLIADVSGLNMVVGENVKAKVTLKLLNVPWDQALELILKLNQLGQLREGNIIWIDTLSNIAKQQDEVLKARTATDKTLPLITRIVYLNYADAAKTLDIAKSSLSTRGEIKTDPRTNALIVRDLEENVTRIAKVVRELDVRTPQVQIEARIVQASKSFARGLGVQWGISQINTQGGKSGPISIALGTDQAQPANNASFGNFNNRYLVNLPSVATGVSIPSSTVGFAIGKFFGTTGTLDMQISAGESLGVTKLVSAPKVLTLDNKAAKIEQGSQVPFQTTSLQGTQTTFVDATLTLNVTPHVIPFDKTIRLEIKATKNSVGAAVSTAGPTIDKKEATTEVLLRDGETTVLGGIFEETRNDSSQGIPWFNRIPFLGWLFKNEGVSLTQTELLVFVTPTIMKD